MSQGAGSSRKIAVLIGLTMIVGGAEISSAATIVQSQSFGLAGPNSVTVVPLSFNLFDPSNGILTQVKFEFTSQINETGGQTGGVSNIQAQLELLTTPGLTFTKTIGVSDGLAQDFSGNATFAAANLAQFIGAGSAGLVSLAYSASCEANLDPPFYCGPGWSGNLGFTYTYDPAAVAAVPLPAALPLFATGLGALGLLGWRRKRKVTATAA